MSRIRKIYKGEENWDSINNDKDNILNKAIEGDKQVAKKFNEDKEPLNSLFSPSTKSHLNFPNHSITGSLSNIAQKFKNVSIAREKDLKEIDNDPNEEEDDEIIMEKKTKKLIDINNLNKSDVEMIDNDKIVYKNEKRKHHEAFTSEDNLSLEEENKYNDKKMKF